MEVTRCLRALGSEELAGTRRFRWAFLSALAAGLAVHLAAITSTWPNGDTINFLYSDVNWTAWGRWLMRPFISLTSFYTLPYVTGLITLLLLAASAAAVCSLFDIRSRAGVIASGAALASFPSVATSISFAYDSEVCFWAMLLCSLAIWLAGRGRLGFLAGGAALGAAVAIYQPYLSYAMTLAAMCAALALLDAERDLKDSLKYIGRLVLTGALGLIVYFVGLRLCMAAQGVALNDYQGVSEMSLAPALLPARIKEAYYDFYVFLTDGITVNGDALLRALIFAAFGIIALGGVFLIIRRRLYKTAARPALLAALALLLPLCTGCIFIVSEGVSYHWLMREAWALFFPFAIAVGGAAAGELRSGAGAASGEGRAKKPRAALGGVALSLTLAVCLLISCKYYIISNIGYYNMQQRYEKSYATALRILDRAEQTEGYYPWIHTVMFGALPSKSEPATGYASADVSALTGMNGDNVCTNGYYTRKFIDNYLNVTLNVPPSDERIASITASEEFAAMECWPAATSMRVIDDTLVVKLSDDDTNYS